MTGASNCKRASSRAVVRQLDAPPSLVGKTLHQCSPAPTKPDRGMGGDTPYDADESARVGPLSSTDKIRRDLSDKGRVSLIFAGGGWWPELRHPGLPVVGASAFKYVRVKNTALASAAIGRGNRRRYIFAHRPSVRVFGMGTQPDVEDRHFRQCGLVSPAGRRHDSADRIGLGDFREYGWWQDMASPGITSNSAAEFYECASRCRTSATRYLAYYSGHNTNSPRSSARDCAGTAALWQHSR